jgi:hypothetical protein
MRFRRLCTAALVAVLAGVTAVLAVPQPAAADGPVYLRLLWIRCQHDTGEWGDDEIRVDVNGQEADYIGGFKRGQTRWFAPPELGGRPVWEITPYVLTVVVWEDDGSATADDRQGVFVVRPEEANTGEHEVLLTEDPDGEWIVRYIVYT